MPRPLRLLPALLLLAACNAMPSSSPPRPSSAGSVAAVKAAGLSILPPGEASAVTLELELSEAAPAADSAEAPRAVEGEALSESEARALLARLPPLEQESGDRQDFALRSGSKPAPRPGRTVERSFPPPPGGAAPEPTAERLEVLRSGPEGRVPGAPSASVTFSQPMVPLSSHDELGARERPLVLEPEPPGTWRWVGARTLLFEPETRFPGATRFEARVAAGTRSELGDRLEQESSWSFETPRLGLVRQLPTGRSVPLEPVIVLGFDQRVDAEALLPHLSLRSGRREVGLRLASPEELAADEGARRLFDSLEEGQRLALSAGRRLPSDADYQLVVEAGAPSAEGPLPTEAEQSFTFHTYGPFVLSSHRCGWNEECRPGWPWSLSFSNPIDLEAFDPKSVRVSPELADLAVDADGNGLVIHGLQRARTSYRVEIGGELRDVFGQSLGRDQTVEFEVGEAVPSLRLPAGELVVLEPGGARALPVYSMGFETLVVEVQAVSPADWKAWLDWKRERRPRRRPPLPGRNVVRKTLRVAGGTDELVETLVDLSPALEQGLGHALVSVAAGKVPAGLREPPTVEAWVQSTRLGLDALVDSGRILAWTTALQDGRPLSGVELSLEPAGPAATSGADGLASLALPLERGGALLIASKGADSTFLPQNTWQWNENGWRRRAPADRFLWHVLDDRGLYRPGETAHVKGWIRLLTAGVEGDTVLPSPPPQAITWTLSDPRGNELAEGRAGLSALGGFDIELHFPDEANLGSCQLRLEVAGREKAAGATHQRPIELREFRRPEYEVNARASEGPFFAGGSAELTATADYYAGGHLPGADVAWRVTQRAGEFRPPGWREFRFGRWIPWWWQPRPFGGGFARGGFVPPHRGGAAEMATLEGRTNALGAHHLRLDFGIPEPPLPVSLVAEATVQDLNRQAWSARAPLLVHPAACYVGLRTRQAFVEKGRPLDVDVIVTDLDGRAQAGREVVVEAERSRSRWGRGGWIEDWVDRSECRPSVGEEPATCSFSPETGGRWRVRALVSDAEGRKNLTEITTWVGGGEALPSLGVEQETAELIPDSEEYRPGATARLLVRSPFAPAEGLLSTRREGLVETRRFRMEGASTVLELPIAEAHVPNLHVVVELDGEQVRAGEDGRPDPSLPKRPAFARGEIDLKVPPVERALRIEIKPAEAELEPGAGTSVELLVTGAGGEPVAGAELALVVADEAVLALTGYEVLDPLDSFHPERADGVGSERSRSLLLLSRRPSFDEGAAGGDAAVLKRGLNQLQMMEMAPAAPMAASSAMGLADAGAAPPIALRTDFDPLALFAPRVSTDAAGRASVAFDLPDNLTRYRVFAVAVAGDHLAGTGESSITARLPVMARLQAPRFLHFGDRLELPLLVQNRTASPRTVEVALRGSNLDFEGLPARRVEVPGHDRVELRFPAAAAEAGTARVQVAVASGAFADAAQVALPVWTPATSEAFATYGELDEGAVRQPLRVPEDVWPQFGGLEITTSSTALQGLTDAVIYLADYPFDCAEQLASRILAIAALRDVLTAFEAEGLPPKEQLEAGVRRDLEELGRRQNADGGFGFWRSGEPSRPFSSVHVAHALARAEAKGFAVPERLRKRSLDYLQRIEPAMARLDWPEPVRRATLAQALFVRELLGDADPKRARRLLAEAGTEELPLEALAWLLPTLKADEASEAVAAIRRHLLNRVSETASTAEFATSYGGEGWRIFHSGRRSDAVILEALIRVEPRLDLVPKLARGLLAHRVRGRWGSTQENAWVLLALDAYFREYERLEPDFVARAWLGEGLALEQAYRGRSTDRDRVEVPMAWLAEGPRERDLVVAKEGPGRLYWRLGLRYAPRSLVLAPAAHGFELERSYSAVDEKSDVRREDDGSWRVKAGARVRVRVSMATTARRYHVALVDPMPAGFEVVDAGLAVSGELPPEETEPGDRPWGWWWGRWYEHENLRDERAEAFTTLLWPGVHDYSYVCRATTPGRFVVPPSKAEEMYEPETFGRAASDVVIVE